MSGSKGKIIFAILAVLLLLFGGGVTLYPFLNGFWVEYTFHRDAEEFLNHTAVVKEQPAQEGPHVIIQQPEPAEPLPVWFCLAWNLLCSDYSFLTSISSGALFQTRDSMLRKQKKPSSLKQENGGEKDAESQRPF